MTNKLIKLFNAFKQYYSHIFSVTSYQFIPALTYFLLILHYYFSSFSKYGVNYPFMFSMFTFSLFLFFLFPKLINNFYFWLPLTGYYWLFLFDYWVICQNHDILWGYWLLAITASCLVPTERRSKFLSVNASLFIAFVFLISIIHKTISQDFLSGHIMYYQFLFSTKFLFLDYLLPFDYLELLETTLTNLLNLQENLEPFSIEFIPQKLRTLAIIFAKIVYILELLIAILFFFPKKFKVIHYRDFLLLTFICAIYFILQLNGFLFLMVLLGLSQTSTKQPFIRFLYISILLFYITLIT